MADDLSNALNQLQQMLNSDDGGQKLNDMVNALGSMFGGDGNNAPPPNETSSPPKNENPHNYDHDSPDTDGGINLDFLLKLKNIFGKVSNQKDDKTLLLTALRPYMREERRPKLDMIIKLASLAKMGSMLDDFKGLF
jgi:hypothetical protein